MTSRQLAAACAPLPLALAAASPRPPRARALPPAAGARFAISFPAARSAAPLDGRVLLMLSTDTTAEPRFQISDGPNTQLIFGIDVDGLRPGQDAVIDAGAFGYPLESIAQVPTGRYRVQALLNRYETFHRSDGHVVKLPPDKGEGQQWSRKPGNLYSATRWVDFDPRKSAVVRISLDQEIAPIPDPPETRYIKHERIQSKLLTEFWGRPTHLGAHVLLPAGFDEHPNARYPLGIFHRHFPPPIEGFPEGPPGPDVPWGCNAGVHPHCHNRLQRLHGGQPLPGHECLLRTGQVEPPAAPRHPRLVRSRARDPRADEPPRARARHSQPLGRPVGHLGVRLLARGTGRLPQAHLGQADGHDRPLGGRLLAAAPRPILPPSAA